MTLLTNLSDAQDKELEAVFDRIAAYPTSTIDEMMVDGTPEIRDVAGIIWACDPSKSDPEKGIFPEILREIGVYPHDIIYIDDNVNNVMTASTALIISIPYQNPAQLEDELTQLGFEFYA